jgi:aminopeptidase N
MSQNSSTKTLNTWLLVLAVPFIWLSSIPTASAQIFWDENEAFTKIDSLRGTITAERAWWDLTHYNLNIQVFPADSSISGTNLISYIPLSEATNFQIELQEPMAITAASQNGKALKWNKIGPIYSIELLKEQVLGKVHQIEIVFSGKPKVAKRAPWDGGFSWTKDENGNWFIATSNQGEGASLWWPNKDHPYDEPDSLEMTVRVPEGLTHVGNGRLRETEAHSDGTKSFTWAVVNPINNYGVNINIGDYVHFGEVYDGEAGQLDMDYWVLSYNLEKAKVSFKDAVRVMDAFEHWFGPYPFYEDSFKLVEVPYLGMEHQSSVTYGNKFGNGYLGRDLSGTGEGLTFDYIIIHEVGHEWFANNITNSDVADMWVHEGFTSYSEGIFVEYHNGKDAGFKYLRGLRSGISNRNPIIGPYNVRKEGSGDMYSKGSNMIHTIRQIVGSDSTWRSILRGLNTDFRHKTVSSTEVEQYISDKAKYNLKPVFDQYLRDIRIPIFTYRIFNDGIMSYQWSNTIEGFTMPIDILVNGEKVRLSATNRPQRLKLENANIDIEIDPNYYVASIDLTVK